jgi:hypothetical protein
MKAFAAWTVREMSTKDGLWQATIFFIFSQGRLATFLPF